MTEVKAFPLSLSKLLISITRIILTLALRGNIRAFEYPLMISCSSPLVSENPGES